MLPEIAAFASVPHTTIAVVGSSGARPGARTGRNSDIGTTEELPGSYEEFIVALQVGNGDVSVMTVH